MTPDSIPAPVTVVVPTRDRPELLRRTLEAIRLQDHLGPVATIVVHDQSEPDESLVVDDELRPVRVISNDRSPGLAGARNTGIEAAATDLVAFCDDDDAWLPGKVRAQVARLADRPDAALVATGIRVHYGDRVVDRVLDQSEVSFDDLLRSRLTELHPSGFLLRRSLVEQVGWVDEEIPGSYAEDYEFLLRIARQFPVLNIDQPLVDVLWHKKSFFTARWEMIATALSWLLERYPEFDREPAGKARITGQIAFAKAASGHRGDARRWSRDTMRLKALEPRAWLALLVSTGLVGPDTVLSNLHKVGRGI